MSFVEISNLTFAYDGSYDNIFENVSLRLDTDWRLGLIGRNGRGKTTFLRLLAGSLPYRERIAAHVCFDYFPFAIERTDISVRSVLYRACPDLELWRLAYEMNRLELHDTLLDRIFGTLSGGEQVKVLLAALFSRENRFLLIDEPTNHLDAAGRALLAQYLREKSGFILVSHDRAFLDACIDHVLSINRVGLDLQQGNFSSWFENKQRQDAFEKMRNAQLKSDIRRLDEAAKRASAWSDKTENSKLATRNSGLRPDRGFIGHKAAKMMKRSKSIEQRRLSAAEQKSALLHNIETSDALRLSPLTYRTARLAELLDVSIQYGDVPVCTGIRFTIENGARIALIGANGSGKSSLLRLVAGETVPHSGMFQLGSGVHVSYVPQDPSFLSGSLTDYAHRCSIDQSLFLTILRKMDFSRTQFEKDMSALSAGQQKKVLLARSLCQSAHLYIWDEPLNYIDVFSRMQIQQLVEASRATLLFVEHDRAFCERIATKTIALGGKR